MNTPKGMKKTVKVKAWARVCIHEGEACGFIETLSERVKPASDEKIVPCVITYQI